MAKLSKRIKALKAKVDRTKVYAFDNAVALIKECATAKFNESIDVSVQLGVDPKKSDQVVRGSVVLPAGTGKTVRVAVFASGEKAEAAKAAGATPEELAAALELHRSAQMRWDFVSSENSTGFHSPQESARVLADSIDLARQAQIAAQAVLTEKTTTQANTGEAPLAAANP